jgi:hypothetical protein
MAKQGGARPGSGRKALAVEDNVKEAIKQALASSGPDALAKIWAKIISKAKQGSEKHCQLFLSYYYGKPKENLEQPTEMIINVVHRD